MFNTTEYIKELEIQLYNTKKALDVLKEFITKLYLNGNITDEQLERYKNKVKSITKGKE